MKKTSRNIIIAFIAKIVSILAGLIAQRFILKTYGSEMNGLTSAVAQIMSYFTLLEAGLGAASIQALYKPLTANDIEGVSSILNATKKQYQHIAYVFILLWSIMAFVMPFVINSKLNYWFVFTVTFISGIGSILNYLFIGKYTVLLNADKKVYVLYIIDASMAVINCVLKVIVINAGYSIIIVLITTVLTTLLRLMVLSVYFRYNYMYLNKKAIPNMQATKKRWNVLVHNIVGMITNNTDIVILTVFSTLSNVSIYSVYNFIYSNINAIFTTAFSQAIYPTFGHLIEKKEKNLPEFYRLFELCSTVVLHIVLVSALLLTIPFVSLYTASVVDVNYLDAGIAILFAGVQYLYLIRIPAVVIISAGGFFKETQMGAILEAAINICVTIPMFFVLGLKGLLVGTIVALVYRSTDLIIFVYRRVIHLKFRRLVFELVEHMVVAAALTWTYLHWISPNIHSWFQWIFWALATFFMVTIVFGINSLIFYKNDIKKIYHIVFHKGLKRV